MIGEAKELKLSSYRTMKIKEKIFKKKKIKTKDNRCSKKNKTKLMKNFKTKQVKHKG